MSSTISMRQLPLLQKVIVKSKDFDKCSANGHVCVIVKVRKTLFAINSLYKYKLDWIQNDNLGKERPECLDHNYYYMDTEVTPLPTVYPLPFDAKGLPDV